MAMGIPASLSSVAGAHRAGDTAIFCAGVGITGIMGDMGITGDWSGTDMDGD